MASSARMRRVDEAMRNVLSETIATDLSDPRIGFVTVTSVKTSPDLRHARVYVSVLGTDEERASSLEGLQSAHGYLQSRVGSALRLKHTPTLSFGYDDSVDTGMRITELLNEIDDGGGAPA
jgi:ribosome-binding factor A